MLVRFPDRAFLVKTGAAMKVSAEVAQVRAIEALVPGLTRQILAEVGEGDRHGYLGVYFEGPTLTELLMQERLDDARDCGEALAARLAELWDRTRTDVPPDPVYAMDVEKRLGILLDDRPAFRAQLDRPVDGRTGHELLRELARREPGLLPPFSVRVHADLTTDNVIWDAPAGTVRFVDLGRSTRSDYLLDVGKLLGAALREPWPAAARETALSVAERAAAQARELADVVGDPSFDARLQVSCARTLLCSARLNDDGRAAWQISEGLARLAAALR